MNYFTFFSLYKVFEIWCVFYSYSYISQRRTWHPTPVLLPGKSHGRKSLVGCSPLGLKESDTTDWLHFYFSLSCVGDRNGNPLQYSWLENPRDRAAWWAAVCGVAQSQTRLTSFSSSISSSSMRQNRVDAFKCSVFEWPVAFHSVHYTHMDLLTSWILLCMNYLIIKPNAVFPPIPSPQRSPSGLISATSIWARRLCTIVVHSPHCESFFFLTLSSDRSPTAVSVDKKASQVILSGFHPTWRYKWLPSPFPFV